MAETDPLLPARQISTQKFVLLLSSLYFGVFIAAVDSTVTSTLVASIASDLKALDNISWVSTAYLVAYSAFQPLYGKLSDIYGRKHVLLAATFVFGLGCYVCTLGSTIGPVVAGRVLNGVGAGGMLSLSSITVSDYVPSRKRGVYQGFGNIAFGAGAASGGIIGSAAQAYKGWRFAFTVQVPLSFISFLIVSFIMTEKKASSTETVVEDTPNEIDHTIYKTSFERVDLYGSLSLATCVSLFMLGITTGGNQFAWKSWPIFGFFTGTVALFSFFIHWESHRAVEPVLPVWLLTERTILSTCFTNFFASGFVYSIYVYVPIILTAMFDYTPSTISKRIIANFVGVSSGSLISGYIMQRTGKYYVLGLASNIGTIVGGSMFMGIIFLPHKFAAAAWYQYLAFFITGFGYASMLTVSLVCLIATAPKHQATATSAQYTFRGIGSSVGVAVSAALFNSSLLSALKKNITGDHAKKIIRKVFKSVSAINDIPKEYKPLVILSYRSAAIALFGLAIGLAFFATLSCAFAREVELEGSADE